MKKCIFVFIILAMVFVISYNIFYNSFSQENSKLVRDDIIRLHIIANSDSPEDQDLKLDIRDKLLECFSETFKTVEDLESANQLINMNMDRFESIAVDEIYDQGYKYTVKAEIGTFSFPTKVYGETVYPAGDYRALRVVIGEGKGANWWCVMFPPLCFVDISSNVVRVSDKNDLYANNQIKGSIRNDVDNDPSNDPNSGVNNDKNVETIYTFKVVELWKKFKSWFLDISM